MVCVFLTIGNECVTSKQSESYQTQRQYDATACPPLKDNFSLSCGTSAGKQNVLSRPHDPIGTFESVRNDLPVEVVQQQYGGQKLTCENQGTFQH